jgi:hypothetical protein
MDKTNLAQAPVLRKIECPACGAPLHPPTRHSCGGGPILGVLVK